MKKLYTFKDIVDSTTNKKVLIYGAGKLSRQILSNSTLKKLNIVGISDLKFKNNKNKTFLNLPAYSPDEIETIDYDILLILLQEPKYIKSIIKSAENSKHNVFHFTNGTISFDKLNKIFLKDEFGYEKEISESELPSGFQIMHDSSCYNNIVKLTLPQDKSNVVIQFREGASNCYFELDTTKYNINLHALFSKANNIKVKIDKNVSICSAFIGSNASDSEIEIGNDCMIASNVCIRGSDGHTIYDLNTGKLINKQCKKLTIGNHVWLGDNSRILKNAGISDGSIVGDSAVVTKTFEEENVIIAGNPARIVKRNILWKRDIVL